MAVDERIIDMQLIDGKATATAIKAEIAEEVKEIVARGGKQPHLARLVVSSQRSFVLRLTSRRQNCWPVSIS